MAFSERDYKEFLQFLEDKNKAQEPEPEVEEKPGIMERLNTWLNSIQESKGFDFFVNISIATLAGFFCFFVPKWFLDTFPWVPATLAETLMLLGITAQKFFFARLIVDLSIYFSENVFWNFLKRNGDNSFDLQENLKKLTPWQQSILSEIKYISYLVLFALLMLT